jgi:hypothetical protein
LKLICNLKKGDCHLSTLTEQIPSSLPLPTSLNPLPTKMGSASTFDYASLKESLKDIKGEVLLPVDGAKYEKSIERWGEQCIKRAVCMITLHTNCLFH